MREFVHRIVQLVFLDSLFFVLVVVELEGFGGFLDQQFAAQSHCSGSRKYE